MNVCMVNTMVIGHTMGKLEYMTTTNIATWSLHGHFSAKTITTTFQCFIVSYHFNFFILIAAACLFSMLFRSMDSFGSSLPVGEKGHTLKFI